MKKISKLVLFAFVFLSTCLLNAQAPPPPIGGPIDGDGGTTPETAAAPIDMYVIFLAIIAVVFIIHFVRKHQKNIV